MSLNNLFRKKSVDQILKNAELDSAPGGGALAKTLGVRDLIAFGIAAIIGAGIFSTIGKASAMGGPGVILLFVGTAIACSFAALAYAEFASLVPVSGSAYTYSYVAFGELFAWIIGWALIMEYAIGNITVAISWSDYFTSLFNSINFNGVHWHMPEWMTMDYFTAQTGFETVSGLLASGETLDSISKNLDYANEVPKYLAWKDAPTLGGFHFVLDIPAIGIIILITALVYRGMKETRNASNIMVAIKVLVVLMVIIFGAMYIDTENWHPFLPNGVGGLLGGVSAVFFAYIGFDAISTTAEECKNPQRDLPRGILYSIVICTVLYILVALVVTGMVSYKELNVGDPLAYVFEKINELQWLKNIIAVSAVVAMASVLLVFQMGQPRIWLAMSRDGLLPKSFSRIHPRFRTPSFATVVTGFMVAVPAFFFDLNIVVDVCSLGTLFAFVLVCAGVLQLDRNKLGPRGKFRVPFIGSRFIFPAIIVLAIVLMAVFNADNVGDFLRSRELKEPAAIATNFRDGSMDQQAREYLSGNIKLAKEQFDTTATEKLLSGMEPDTYSSLVRGMPVGDDVKFEGGWNVFKHNIPMWVFFLITAWMTVRCAIRNLSLIPVLGLVSCLYMMAQLGSKNWLLFTGWLVVGLIIYFTYSRYNSKLAKENAATKVV